jgi:hypothetical protein
MSGELFRIEVDGELRLTRMEEVWGEGYYSIDLYPLRDGMRAVIGGADRVNRMAPKLRWRCHDNQAP